MENKEPELVDKESLAFIENELSIEEFSNIGIEVPQMNVSIPDSTMPAMQNDATHLISDEKFLKVLDETIESIKEDRKQVSDYVDTFADLVINEGDASSATKEAFVNLLKIKTDLQDKMLKAVGEMTKIKLKNSYAYSGPHLNALQQNNFNISKEETSQTFNRKELIKAINNKKKKED
jgi:hypothetical protein